MNLFIANMNARHSYTKQIMGHEQTSLLTLIYKKERIGQLSLGKKVTYVSVKVSMDLKKAFELTGLELWHRNKRIKDKNKSHKQ